MARQRAPCHLARAVGTKSSGTTAGSESIGTTAGTGSPGIGFVWLDSGHRVTRHQVVWLASGHRAIWQGSGLRVNWYDRGHWVRHWIV
ncbi:unnamed protein product [Staurois parvus]|uniref:Uncharacterized protein n=1 Tax=Staurois parvus TaxID=386267 RepID=A0ABN9A980_9NEOB|nr:unnamed protein product [Staurois parvus]